MRRTSTKRLIASVLAIIMVLALMPAMAMPVSAEEGVFTLDATADLTAFAAGERADGDTEIAGTDGYFTVVYSAKTKVDASSKTFEDGHSATQRLNFGGSSAFDPMKNAVKFTTSATATVNISADLNFTLRAKVTVDSWTLSNGQEGFGLMAADRLGPNGDSASFWNNQYMAMGGKVEYYSESGAKYSMKLGLGTLAKTGLTPENLPTGAEMPEGFKTVTTTLDHTQDAQGQAAGTYNIVGNATASVNAAGDVFTAEQFVSLTFQGISRKSDGSIDLKGFMELVSDQPVNPFLDVTEEDFYYDAVLWALEKGITTGTTQSAFEPLKACDRAQVVTFLYRAYGA